jgi:hypothetical protein
MKVVTSLITQKTAVISGTLAASGALPRFGRAEWDNTVSFWVGRPLTPDTETATRLGRRSGTAIRGGDRGRLHGNRPDPRGPSLLRASYHGMMIGPVAYDRGRTPRRF